MDYTIFSDTTNPPLQTISTLPQAHTWWTVRAYDQYGSTIYADPRLIKLPENRPPVADAGPNQVLFAGLDGKATVALSGAQSTDPDGNALNYAWAWAIGTNAYWSNGVSLTIELPLGVHTIQLMVNDGHVTSQPDEVKITVVAPCRNVIVAAATNCMADASVQDGSLNPDGDTFTVRQLPPPPYPLGTNLVTLTVSDSSGASNSCTAQVIVVDTKPPALVCPSNQLVEFASAAGARVNFTPQANDLCSTLVTVACEPPSGSMFPIGTTEVHCVATDVAGNSASCSFQVAVLGARGVKSNVLAELIASRDNPALPRVPEGLNDAINWLTASLASSYWIDQTHVTRRDGETVFHDERAAVHALWMNHRESPALPKAVWEGWIARIVKADRLLAVVAIQDAANAGVRPEHLVEAQRDVAQGDDDVVHRRYQAAIDHYRNAWHRGLRLVVKLAGHLDVNGSLHLEFTASPGETYVLESSTNLVDWMKVKTATIGPDGVGRFEVAPGGSSRLEFYRARAQP